MSVIGDLCNYCPTSALDDEAMRNGVRKADQPCYKCSDFSHFSFDGLKAKDKEILDLKEQVASLQRALAHNRDRDSEVDG